MNFNDFKLDRRLLEAAAEAGYTIATPVQEQAIPVCSEGTDLIATAATGTGKTAAFVLPILQRLITRPLRTRSPRALIVTPTRELAEQILSVIRHLARRTGMRSAAVYGGVGFEPQKRALNDGTEIVVCCPGRLLDHLKQGNCRLDSIETVVLDEADRMLDMGFLPDIRRILDALPTDRQTLLFSATFAAELMDLIRRYLRNPKRVSVDTEKPAETVDHCFYPVSNHLKTDLLLGLLGSMDCNSVLVFTRTKHRANKVMERLARAGFPAGVLHANKSQNQRLAAMEGFRSGKLKVLVATDIAARGIDIACISHVVNYDIPDTATTYIHRIGRTGRAERSGDALTFITPEDAVEVREIERKLGCQVEKKKLAGFDYSKPRPETNEFSRPPRQGRYPSSQRGYQQGHGQDRPHSPSRHSGHPVSQGSSQHRGYRPSSAGHRRPEGAHNHRRPA